MRFQRQSGRDIAMSKFRQKKRMKRLAHVAKPNGAINNLNEKQVKVYFDLFKSLQSVSSRLLNTAITLANKGLTVAEIKERL